MEDPKILDVDPLPLAPLVLDTLQTLGCYPHHPVRVAGRMRQNMKFDALCDFVEEELQDIKRRMQARQATSGTGEATSAGSEGSHSCRTSNHAGHEQSCNGFAERALVRRCS